MNTKTYYLFDENGNFTITYDAFRDLDIKDGYITPILSTDIAPEFLPDTFYKWNGTTWEVNTIAVDLLITNAMVAQINLLEATYQAVISANLAYMGTLFSVDYASRVLISQILAIGSVMDGFYFQDVYNVQVGMTYLQLQGMAGEIFIRGQAAFTHLQLRKSTLRALVNPTVDAIAAIVW
jgi:hypothetical protein